MKLIDTTKIQPVVTKVKRYKVMLFLLVFLGIYGGLTYRINALTNQEPTEQAISEKSQTVKRISVDKDSIEKLKQLEAQNIDVQTLFSDARKNPFTE